MYEIFNRLISNPRVNVEKRGFKKQPRIFKLNKSDHEGSNWPGFALVIPHQVSVDLTEKDNGRDNGNHVTRPFSF